MGPSTIGGSSQLDSTCAGECDVRKGGCSRLGAERFPLFPVPWEKNASFPFEKLRDEGGGALRHHVAPMFYRVSLRPLHRGHLIRWR